jgi:hypothetical protein
MSQVRHKRLQALIEQETALTPQMAAELIGCQPDEVTDYVSKFHVINGRKKFRSGDVLKVRDRMRRETARMNSRNREMIREAGRR